MVPGGVELRVADFAPDGHLVQKPVLVHPAANVFVDLGNVDSL